VLVLLDSCQTTAGLLTVVQVTGHVGDAELAGALEGAQVVVIPAGVPRKPGTRCFRDMLCWLPRHVESVFGLFPLHTLLACSSPRVRLSSLTSLQA
jgi:hypothetical protein